MSLWGTPRGGTNIEGRFKWNEYNLYKYQWYVVVLSRPSNHPNLFSNVSETIFDPDSHFLCLGDSNLVGYPRNTGRGVIRLEAVFRLANT